MSVQAMDPAVEQRRAALARANELRLHRAGVKRELRAGRVSLRSLLLGDDDGLQGILVLDLLLATPRVGRVKASKVLSRARVAPSRQLRSLTERQRLELLGLLGRWAS